MTELHITDITHRPGDDFANVRLNGVAILALTRAQLGALIRKGSSELDAWVESEHD